MAGLKWTSEQQRAIETRGKNLLVSAGAGAGKTAVLVERIMRLITHPTRPVDINRILVVTFTNAAAEEMRSRISSALHSALHEDPGSALLNRQIALLEQASITTMHSFCLDTVRRYFHLVDMDPAFRVGDEHELSLLRLDVLTALFEDRYGSPETAAGFSRLVDIYGGERGDLALQNLVFRLYDFVRSTPRPRHWFAAVLERWNVDETQALDDLAWVKDLRRDLQLKLEHAHALLRGAQEIGRMPEGPAAYLELLPSELEAARRLVCGDYTWAELAREVKSVEFKRLPPSRGGDKGMREQAQKLRTEARKILKNMADTYFARTPEGWIRDMRAVHPVLCDLVDLTIAFDKAFTAAKRNRSLVDFSDLEHLCLRILGTHTEDTLTPSAVARELRDWHQEIMVDEYQDINGIQETILKMIKRPEGGPGNLFLVGDVKQSIYRFRLAEPDLFLHKYHTYPQAPEAAGSAARIDLTRNFRSHRAVIDAVNDVFGRIMTTETGEIEYDESAELNYGAEYPEPLVGAEADPVELHIIDQTAENAADEEVYQAAEAEALLAVTRIKALVEGAPGQKSGQVYDRRLRGYRPLTYRDIVVLLRSPAGQANTFVEVFHRAGVPVCADLGAGYFAAVEVEAMLSLLSIIDNPHQDIPLAGVLRAPWCGFDARDLTAIRIARTDGDFYTCVQAAAERENPLGKRLRAFLSRLGKWRTFARRRPLPELIWQIYRETGYYEFVGGLPGGAQRQANLRALHNRARRYEQTTYRGLFRFLRFIERVREKGDDLGTAQPLGENEDVVRIMSVHRSKGLEFPVVLLAGLGKQFNFRDCYREVLLHKDLGLATDVINPEARLRYPTLFKYLVRDQLKAESLAEEMRILYVALTRARERLVLIGSGKPDRLFGTGIHGACPVLHRMKILGAKSFLQWITLALGEHSALDALEPVTHCGPWVINIVNPAGLMGEADMSARPQADPAVVARLKASEPVRTGEMQEDIAHRLQWRYGRLPETVRPVKLTATELYRREPVVDEAAPLKCYRPYLVRKPRCLQETVPLTASEYGTAVHLVLQHIDWNAVTTEEVRREIERMKVREMISENQARAVDAALIARFLQSKLAARIRNGEAFRREVPFTLRLPAAEFYPDVQADEWVLVQGVIDGLLTEANGFVIIDYKTDRVPPEGARMAADRYRGQLDLYARAVETITGDRVKEKYIYLFDAEVAIQL